jgi:hypothetical protein
MATFVAGDVGKIKELRVSGVTRKARIDAVNVGGSTVSYTPLRMTPDPREVVPAPVVTAAWSTVNTQADWPSFFASPGRGQPDAGPFRYEGESFGAYPRLQPRSGRYPR